MAVGWLIIYGALLQIIQARFAQVMGTFGWKTLMAAYYAYLHEGQRTTAFFQVLPSAADLAIIRTTGRKALPQPVHKQAAPK